MGPYSYKARLILADHGRHQEQRRYSYHQEEHEDLRNDIYKFTSVLGCKFLLHVSCLVADGVTDTGCLWQSGRQVTIRVPAIGI
jgi:hypothetical protein